MSSLRNAINEHFKPLERHRREIEEAMSNKKRMQERYPDIVKGAIVTIKSGECRGYYSGYGGTPEFTPFKPGMKGVVGAITVPKISVPNPRPHDWNDYFVCVDYLDENDVLRRCSVEYSNLEVIKDE